MGFFRSTISLIRLLRLGAKMVSRRGKKGNQPVSGQPVSRKVAPGAASGQGLRQEPEEIQDTPQFGVPAADAIREKLDDNLEYIKQIFSIPANSDIIVREFEFGTKPPRRGALVFIEGLTDRETVNLAILEPLMVFAKFDQVEFGKRGWEAVMERLLPSSYIEAKRTFEEVIRYILTGMTALFVDGEQHAFIIETKKWERRGVESPLAEQVVRGPHEAFNETLRTNTALLRRRIRSPRLVMESLRVGTVSGTDVVISYIQGLVNPAVLDEVKRRLDAIKAAVDYIPDSGFIEEFIEDQPFALFPQTLATERPDRVGAFLSEGCVSILVDGSPNVLIVPTTFFAYFHSPEDYYLRWPFGAVLRVVRAIALASALFLPAFYIALATFHPEMIPTSLLLSIAASREVVPFPVFVEAILMEVSFELIREAGIRIPSPIGPTLGIVGAIVLGQAAVAASIVSPTLVIIVAITGLGSLALPSFPASFSVRLLRFPMMILAGAFGFYGIAAGAFALVVHITSLKSFGVPYMSPVAPLRPGTSPDVILRGPLWSMERRPSFLGPLDLVRQRNIVRSWVRGEEATGTKKEGTRRE